MYFILNPAFSVAPVESPGYGGRSLRRTTVSETPVTPLAGTTSAAVVEGRGQRQAAADGGDRVPLGTCRSRSTHFAGAVSWLDSPPMSTTTRQPPAASLYVASYTRRPSTPPASSLNVRHR